MNYIKIKQKSFLNRKSKYIQIKCKEFVTNSDKVDLVCDFYEDIDFKSTPALIGELLFSVTVSMSGKDLSLWKADDTYAEDWVMNELGVSRY